ncbi:hypothetical protein MRS44_018742 [Fusarium solani]|uniref:uncharacterized protein n=1 Tax=Fusarium solani TaxID=169388 RepID=UPI0032C41C74|nr:hypothetical protein MRS44_018742 [Fusarium solani]
MTLTFKPASFAVHLSTNGFCSFHTPLATPMERLSSEILCRIMGYCNFPDLIALISTSRLFHNAGWLKLLGSQFPASSTVAVVPAIVSTYEDPDICLSLLRKAIDAGSKPTAVKQSITFCPESKSFKWVPQTALHVAASLGLSRAVDFLLDIGVPHERKTTDSRSVLEAAVYANKLGVVRTLVDRISISKQDQNAAIYAAVAIGSKAILELFLSKGWALGPNDQTHVFEAALYSPLGAYQEMIPYLKAHGVQITEDAFVTMWGTFYRPAAIPSLLPLGKSLRDAFEEQEVIYAADVFMSIGESNPDIPGHVIAEKMQHAFFIGPEATVRLLKGNRRLRRNVWDEVRRLAVQFATGPEGIKETREEISQALRAFQTKRDYFHQEWVDREIAFFPKSFVTIVDSLIATGFELSFAGLEKKLFQVPY